MEKKTKDPIIHAIIFGYDFPDKTLHTERKGYKIYESKELHKYGLMDLYH